MTIYRQKKNFKWKRNFSRFAAVLFLLYAFADISVLQEYCGKENFGINSYHQKVHTENNLSQTVADISPASHHKQTPDIPGECDDCFCCSSHTLLVFNAITPKLLQISVSSNSVSNFSLKHRQTETHLSQLYQPPKPA